MEALDNLKQFIENDSNLINLATNNTDNYTKELPISKLLETIDITPISDLTLRYISRG